MINNQIKDKDLTYNSGTGQVRNSNVTHYLY